MNEKTLKNCRACGAAPGQLHGYGCDVEPCPCCGTQAIACDYLDGEGELLPRLPWTGEWPGVAECREFGFYAVEVPRLGLVSCSPDTPGARENLNRLHDEAEWNQKTARWVRHNPSEGR